MRVVRRLKALAKRQDVSMEQAIRDLLDEHVGGRSTVLAQIEDTWKRQTHRPTADEIDRWIAEGRSSQGEP